MDDFTEIRVAMPDWLLDYERATPALGDDEAKMQWVLGAGLRNISDAGGGPFAAGVFNCEDRGLVALGVNRVMATGLSFAHAEMLAIARAQRRLGSYNLLECGSGRYELFSSAEPCAMCQGAIPWAGLRRLVYAARDEDIRAIGFDEGHKSEGWQQAFVQRGIEVAADCSRAAGQRLLQRYAAQGGVIYNGKGL